MLGRKQYAPPRVVIRRPKPVIVVLSLPVALHPARVKELPEGSLTPRNTSCPLILKTALPLPDPQDAAADLTKEDVLFHWLIRNSNWFVMLPLMKWPMSPRKVVLGCANRTPGRTASPAHNAMVCGVRAAHNRSVAWVVATDVRPDRAFQPQRIILLRILTHVSEIIQLAQRQDGSRRVRSQLQWIPVRQRPQILAASISGSTSPGPRTS